jgi:hypothetical protein
MADHRRQGPLHARRSRRGVVEGVRALCEKAGVQLAHVDNLLHGTTVATNIVLTHSGAEVGMLTTHGFRDILHIARHKKPFNFSLQQELPWQSRPLVKRRHRLTVRERVTVPAGEVLTELPPAARRGRRGRGDLPPSLVPQPSLQTWTIRGTTAATMRSPSSSRALVASPTTPDGVMSRSMSIGTITPGPFGRSS